ncbi:MAG: hypothetical protein RMJ18_02390 [Candidatus Aenigmarchaeota archaeon]|nr:hypothetical protein [Candidatus Aenigmarchaeota archaeon]MDW8160243.1 hypothetical protein [Candidatus Aenigmarchaeota archaeon]
MEAIVAHSDADGIISAVLLNKIKPTNNIYFSSNSYLLKTFCSLIIRGYSTLSILDISPNKKTIILSSVFDKVNWIDHHIWEEFKIPENVNVFNEQVESTAKLVSKIFNINDELVEIADEIDTNNVKSEKADFFRKLISAIKWKYKNYQIIKFRQIVKYLTANQIEKLEKNEECVKVIDEFNFWLKEKIEDLLERIRIVEVNNKKIILVESINGVPVYEIFNAIKSREDFDLLTVFYRRIDYRTKKIITKLEFRSPDKIDVLKIARVLNGGGHKFASGCLLDYYLSQEDFVKKIETLL